MTANPTLLSMPLAQNGQKNVIPETQATPGNGLFSQSTGFPAETSLPLGAGGVAPSREDFNGMANLLGGVAFYAQKGFTFNYDATQDYYAGCIVIDTADGLRYECIADMTAGTIAPHDDTTNTYWTIFKNGLDADKIPACNKRDVVTSSGTYTAPITGWYKITAKGGGGGGGGGAYISSIRYGGTAGGEGGTYIAYKYMTAGTSATVVIGGGGTGGTATTSTLTAGANGGNTTVTIGGNTYSGGGGAGGSISQSYSGGEGGIGTIKGCSGAPSVGIASGSQVGATGAGNGGVCCVLNVTPSAGTDGAGGAGGYATSSGGSAGGAGGNGYVWFEYFDTSLNP